MSNAAGATTLTDCLDELNRFRDDLEGLGGIVFGLVQTATHSEVSENSLSVIMSELYGLSDRAAQLAASLAEGEGR